MVLGNCIAGEIRFKQKNSPKSELPVAESLWQRIITLPCSTGISEDELSTVVLSLKKAIGKINL